MKVQESVEISDCAILKLDIFFAFALSISYRKNNRFIKSSHLL